jgi:hypothetical protein
MPIAAITTSEVILRCDIMLPFLGWPATEISLVPFPAAPPSRGVTVGPGRQATDTPVIVDTALVPRGALEESRSDGTAPTGRLSPIAHYKF